MTRSRSAILLLSAVSLCTPFTFAGTLNLSTGLDAGSNLITTDLGCDAHWTQTAGPAPSCANSKGQVVMTSDADWYGGWLADGSSSNWITSNAQTTANGSPLPSYQIQFYLTNTVGATFSGSWAIDDVGTISLNGTQIAALGSGAWGGLSPIGGNPAADLQAGLNTLTITMTNSDDFLEAVRFEGSVTGNGASFSAPSGVPEPASVLLLLTGAGALLTGLRRKVRS